MDEPRSSDASSSRAASALETMAMRAISTFSSPEDAAHHYASHMWYIRILKQLDNPQRFNQLKSLLPGISSKTLSINLKEMEDADMIARKVLCEKPLRVEYSQTEKGVAYVESYQNLIGWANNFCKIEPRKD